MSDSSSGQPPIPNGPAVPEQTLRSGPPNPLPLPPDVAKTLEAILTQQGFPRQKTGVVVQKFTTEFQRFHSGPLPTVADFQGYETVCPGAARDIVDMAMKQQNHLHAMDRWAVKCDAVLPFVGIFAAVFVILSLLGTGVYLAMNSHESLSVAVFSGTGVATIIGAFLNARRSAVVDLADEQKKDQKQPKKR